MLPGWNEPPAECCGNWTPDGKYFLFQATREGKTEVWALRERGGWLSSLRSRAKPVQVTAGQLNSLAPVLSADGKKLYVVGQHLRGELIRYDSKSHEWVSYLSGISAEFVDFSRDGQWMTYVAFPENTLWRSRIDGTDRLQLTTGPMQASAPRWSPNGKRIAFQTIPQNEPSRIYMISSDGGTPELILKEQHNQARPSWSPVQESLAFSYIPWLEAAPRRISVINLATHKLIQLPKSEGLFLAEWSSDGRYIAARRADHQALMLFDWSTHTWSQLARVELNWANWSRDGQQVYFERHGREHAILSVRITDHALQEVVSLAGIKRAGLSGGFWFGLTPDNSPIVLRDTGTQEIYALDWHEP